MSATRQATAVSNTHWEDIDPLEKSFIPIKQQAFHRYLHPYFTKQAHNIVQNYIKYYSSPGEIVCDPFSGTGVVGSEAISLGRSAICVDISPLAEFMAKVLLSKDFDHRAYENAYNTIISKVGTLCEKIETIGDINPILNFQNLPSWVRKINISTPSLNRKLPRNADVATVRELFDQRQLLVGSLLKGEIDKVSNSQIKETLQLALCGALARSNLTYLHSSSRGGSVLHNGGPSIFGEYRYHVPSKPVYVPMYEMFCRRVKYLKQIKTATNSIYSAPDNSKIFAKVIRGNTLELSDLVPKNSVDYIYTDPPYGAHIAYLDLATMWADWMGWKITEKDKKSEVIEGGDVGNSTKRYLELLNKSIEESYKVLKPGRWLSIVFQHKDSAIWGALVNGFKDIGFQYRSTVVQRTFNSSIHKKKNPLNVLAEQLILNFTKSTRVVVAFKGIDIPVKDLVIEAATKAILIYDGATIDDIYNTITPSLIEAGLLHNSKAVLDNLEDILNTHFSYDRHTNKYKLKSNAYLKTNFGTSDKIILYLRSVFNKVGNPTLDQIITSVLPNIADDRNVKNSDLFNELTKIAKTKDGKTFVLRDALEEEMEANPILAIQDNSKIDPLMGRVSHNDIILRLAQIGQILGYQVWIGKPEQAKTVRGIKLSKLSIDKIPFQMSAPQKRLLNQIDCMWLRDGVPLAAFEVESTTDIEGALRRFHSLLELAPHLVNKLYVIANDSMRQKLKKVFTTSVYAGQPHLMQSKVCYAFLGTFVDSFNTLVSTPNAGYERILSCFTPGTMAIEIDALKPSNARTDQSEKQLDLFNSSKKRRG